VRVRSRGPVVGSVVSHREMGRHLPDDGPRSTALAAGPGAALSSRSDAATLAPSAGRMRSLPPCHRPYLRLDAALYEPAPPRRPGTV
jgi:hypothetical protein